MNSQIESSINKTSAWQRLYAALFLLAVWFITLSVDLSWYWNIGVLILCLLLYKLTSNRDDQPLHIATFTTDESTTNWQLLYKANHTTEIKTVLWEAELVAIQGFPHCIQCRFRTTHPTMVNKTVTIWRDQISVSTWRRLKVLANWH